MEELEKRIVKVPTNLVDALKGCQEEALELLELTGEEAPQEIVLAIYEYVTEELENPDLDIDSEDYFENIMQFGALWGEMVHREYQWQWIYLLNEEDNPEAGGVIYLVSPEQWYVCPPLDFMNKIMRKENPVYEGGDSDNTIMLLFNMMENLEKDRTTTEKYTSID